jgi:hypothetical protein
VADDKPAHDKAIELLVYAPVGVALYLRDMLPSMMPMFVSRGKREVQSHLPGGPPVPPTPPMPPMPPMPSTPSPADVRRKVEEGIGLAKVAADTGVGVAKGVAGGGFDLARGLAGSAIQGLGNIRPDTPTPATPTAPSATTAPPSTDPTSPAQPAPHAAPYVSPTPAPEPSYGSSSFSSPTSPTSSPGPDIEVGSLAIPDYDELSASQVVERLDGLDAASLDAIKRYERAHRGRNTILGKIAQLD